MSLYQHSDPNTGVELTTDTYPYGRGTPGKGLQVTLVKDLTVLPVRLPATQVMALLRALVVEFADEMANSGGALLQPHEVASMFRVDAKTVNRWAATGRLPAVRTMGGHRRYRLTDVLAALEPAAADA